MAADGSPRRAHGSAIVKSAFTDGARWRARKLREVQTMPTLRISPEKVCFVVVKARELDVKVAPEWMDDGSNPTDDQMAQILEDYADDATLDELRSYLQALNDEELEDLLALTWLGRGDYTLSDWDDLMTEVRDVRDYRTVDYLIGTPLLADYLENGLSEFGLSCAEFELGRM
jgi:Protein of unknown function (DUF3775)